MHILTTLLTTILGLWGTYRVMFPTSHYLCFNEQQRMIMEKDIQIPLQVRRNVGLSVINEWIMRKVLMEIKTEKNTNKDIEKGKWIIIIHYEIIEKIQKEYDFISILSLRETTKSPFTTSIIFIKDFKINRTPKKLTIQNLIESFDGGDGGDGGDAGDDQTLDLKTTLHLIYYILVEGKGFTLLNLIIDNKWIIGAYLLIIFGFLLNKIC